MNNAPTNKRAHSWATVLLFVCALSTLLLVYTCEAQKPKAANSAPSSDVAAKIAPEGQRYSEPGLKGRIVDAETKQPIAGAIIYGYYATSEGTLAGGRKFVQGVKSFAATTDAQGVFTLEAWDTGDRLIKGEVSSDFPMISIYKPGYVLEHRNLASIRKWRPLSAGRHPETGALDTLARLEEMDPTHPTKLPKPNVTENLIDWSRDALPLYPVQTERERFEVLDNSSVGVMYMGDCGWEVYAPLLLAQHNELREWMHRNIPPERIKPDGTLKPNFVPPFDITFGSQYFYLPTAAEKLIKAYDIGISTWRCAKPNDLFAIRK